MMGMKDRVLDILFEDGQNEVSGQSIAEKLGVSRNSIWKTICQLREEGYEISSGTNKGYRLSSCGNIMSDKAVKKYLSGKESFDIQVYDVCGSTNTLLKELGEAQEKEGKVIIADEQTAGKGRVGRFFHSPKKSGIYMSILLRPTQEPAIASLITAAAGVAVACAIEEISGKNAQIKWVNDIYLSDKKVCGILTEATMDMENGHLKFAVLGIGINLLRPVGYSAIDGIAGGVFDGSIPNEARARMCARVLDIFMGYYRNLSEKTFMHDYRRRSNIIGREVEFFYGDDVITGIAQGIDDEAALILRLPDGSVKSFSSGEISLHHFHENLRYQKRGIY